MSYSPEFKGPIQGYVVNFLKSNYWRVAATQQRSDVMQDAYIVFMRVSRAYPDMDTPQHFMSLFKRSWVNHFTDLSNQDTASRALCQLQSRSDEGESNALDFDPVGDLDNDGTLAIMLRQAPKEVVSVLNLFLNAPQEILECALRSWNGPDKRRRAGGSEKINKLLGLPKHVDALQAVHDYFH